MQVPDRATCRNDGIRLF